MLFGASNSFETLNSLEVINVPTNASLQHSIAYYTRIRCNYTIEPTSS